MVGFPFLFIFTAARAAIPDQPRFYIPSFCGSTGAQGAETTGKGAEDGEEAGAGWEKDGRIVAETFPPDILRHFVSNPKVEGVGASPGIGPYSTFMALNRDEVSMKLPSLPIFFFLFSLPLSLPSFHAYTRFFFETGMLRSENDLSLIYSFERVYPLPVQDLESLKS